MSNPYLKRLGQPARQRVTMSDLRREMAQYENGAPEIARVGVQADAAPSPASPPPSPTDTAPTPAKGPDFFKPCEKIGDFNAVVRQIWSRMELAISQGCKTDQTEAIRAYVRSKQSVNAIAKAMRDTIKINQDCNAVIAAGTEAGDELIRAFDCNDL